MTLGDMIMIKDNHLAVERFTPTTFDKSKKEKKEKLRLKLKRKIMQFYVPSLALT